MINLDFYTLKEFLVENKDFLSGAKLQKIQQPTRRDFILSLRNMGESRKFYINISPQMYHVAFATVESIAKRGIIIPKNPPMFCMLLRKYIEGAKIIDSNVAEGERILEFYFEVIDELGNKRILCLAIELMGKHSNVILYDKADYTIIGCAHNVGAEKSKFRELQGGLKYIYPPKGINNISKVKIPLYEALKDNYPQNSSVNTILDGYFSTEQQNLVIKTKKTKLKENINTKLNKNIKAISKIEALLAKRDKTDKYKLYGELLTTNAYKKIDYVKSIELFDYTSGSNIIIDLNETKTLNENAHHYFKLYSKSKKTKEKSEEMLNELKIKDEYFENILYSISMASDFESLAEIESEIGVSDEKETKKKLQKINIEKVIIEGFEVYIGKNNKQNDYIVSRLAKDEDIWFHTRLCAGSHILLKTLGKEPNEEVIFECCKLARKYSSAAQPSKVGIIYTKAKNLRKPPAAPLGYVTYKNEKEILV